MRSPERKLTRLQLFQNTAGGYLALRTLSAQMESRVAHAAGKQVGKLLAPATHYTRRVITNPSLPTINNKPTVPSDCPPGGFLVCTPTPDTSTPASQNQVPTQPSSAPTLSPTENTQNQNTPGADYISSQLLEEIAIGVGGAGIVVGAVLVGLKTLTFINKIANAGGGSGGGRSEEDHLLDEIYTETGKQAYRDREEFNKDHPGERNPRPPGQP